MPTTTTKKRKKYKYTARTADKHRLYEISVQCPEADVDFLDEVYREENGRRPLTLMEDFCGTALLSKTWVESLEGRSAVGVDIDPDVLAWARQHNLRRMGRRARNVELIEKSVLDVSATQVDVRVAFNFSYSLFHRRSQLLEYFEVVRPSLAPGGMFVLDLHGGPEAQQETVEKKTFPGFKYVWEQGPFNPVDARVTCYIHFEFPDRSRLKRAFVYDWRLWNLMELREILEDAGFSRTSVYWEGTDEETGEGDGVYTRCDTAENDPSWIAYIVAWP